MAKKRVKKRAKKKGPSPNQPYEAKKSYSKGQIFMLIVGVLVIISMTAGLLVSAFSAF